MEYNKITVARAWMQCRWYCRILSEKVFNGL